MVKQAFLTPEQILENWSLYSALWMIEEKVFDVHRYAFHAAIRSATKAHETFLREIARYQQGDLFGASVAHHPHAPVDILEYLSNHTSYMIRQAVAGNAQTPASALSLLARDSHDVVRLSAARNTSIDLVSLSHLLKDHAQRIQIEAQQNPNFHKLSSLDLEKLV